MEASAIAVLEHPVARVFAELRDLTTYPQWLRIVAAVEAAPVHPNDGGPAWFVELEARVGPVRRRKRVRMVRTELVRPELVRFERAEQDAREHPEWILTAELVAEAEALTRVRMHLRYSGSGWLPGVDLVLREEMRRAGRRLARRLDPA